MGGKTRQLNDHLKDIGRRCAVCTLAKHGPGRAHGTRKYYPITPYMLDQLVMNFLYVEHTPDLPDSCLDSINRNQVDRLTGYTWGGSGPEGGFA